MIEVYKYLQGLSPELMIDIFTLWKGPYNIRFIQYWFIWLMRFRVDVIEFCASQLWQKVPIKIKYSSSLELFKAKIKFWN